MKLADAPAGYRVVFVPAAAGPVRSAADVAPAIGDLTRHLDAMWSADRPDVVHSNSWAYGIAAQRAANCHRLRAVQAFPAVGTLASRRRGSRGGEVSTRLRIEALLAKNATWVAAVSSVEMLELTRMTRSAGADFSGADRCGYRCLQPDRARRIPW